MSLRNLPSSERTFAGVMVLALALALGLGLAQVLTRELRHAVATQTPPDRSRLVAVLEGVMAVNVTPAETEKFRTWVAAGATREGYAQVESVVVNTCASCHAQGAQFPRIEGFEDLRPLALEAAPSGLADLLRPRTLHLMAFPLLFLVAVVGYLRRSAWPRRRTLMVACALAVLFDLTQWSWRQGRPEALWAAWTGWLGLALTMLALVVVVLRELWGPAARPSAD